MRDAVKKSLENENASVLYLNETRDRAARTFWEELKSFVWSAGLPYRANEAKLVLFGPGNRWIWVGGGESKKHVNRWKGLLPKIAAAYIDEAQDWRPDVLVHAYSQVLGPALSDIGGSFTVGGVPGPTPDPMDPWFNWTHSREFSQHGSEFDPPWTIWDNPYVHNARQLLDRDKNTRGVDESDPTIQREYFGRWVRDNQILVFGALDDILNSYDGLPDGDWVFAVGIDGGYVDEASICTLGWRRRDDARKVYVTRSDLFGHAGAHETVDRIRETTSGLGARLLGSYADPAAGMKNIAHDLWARHGVEIESADKQDKIGGIKLLVSAFASRELLLPRGHRLFTSLRRVQWDPDNRGEKLKGHTPDDVDALLYAYRKAYPWICQRNEEAPKTYEQEREERIVREQNTKYWGD